MSLRKSKAFEKGSLGTFIIDKFHTLDAVVSDIEGFDGTIVYATLEKHYHGGSVSVEEYKIVVEPPKLWERLLGITLEFKIRRAISQIKQDAFSYLDSDRNDVFCFRLPQFITTVI